MTLCIMTLNIMTLSKMGLSIMTPGYYYVKLSISSQL
jgi:hypothetical protein